MLYYAGYLTINAYDPENADLSLIFPNTEVSRSFSSQLISELTPRNAHAITRLAVAAAKILRAQSLLDSSSSFMLQDLLNQALANIGYQLLLSRENQYQLAFFMFFCAGGLRTRIEEVTQDGRIDIVIEMRQCIYVIELKIEQPAAMGIAQIKAKDYVRKFKHLNLPMWAVGINLAGKSDDNSNPRNAVLELAAELITQQTQL